MGAIVHGLVIVGNLVLGILVDVFTVSQESEASLS